MNNNLARAEGKFQSSAFFEYFMVTTPGEQVYNKLLLEKREFFEQYRQDAAIKSRPHLAISNFLARGEMEDTIIRWMQRIIGEQKSFPVMLNNYSGFPAHTVFLRIQDHQYFKVLAAQLEPINFYVKSNGCPPVHFNSYPHISIAANLPPAIYEKAISDYSRKLFNDSFEVSELILLKRQSAEDGCRAIAKFQLQPTR